jgi:hypothetical protein
VVTDAVQRGRLNGDEARLILETRVLGDTVAVASGRRRISRRAAYSVRERAENRLVVSQAAA